MHLIISPVISRSKCICVSFMFGPRIIPACFASVFFSDTIYDPCANSDEIFCFCQQEGRRFMTSYRLTEAFFALLTLEINPSRRSDANVQFPLLLRPPSTDP